MAELLASIALFLILITWHELGKINKKGDK